MAGRVTPRLHPLQSNAACYAVAPPSTTAGASPRTHNSNAEAPRSFYQAGHKCGSPPGHPTTSSNARRRLQQGARGRDAEADSRCLLCKKGNPGPWLTHPGPSASCAQVQAGAAESRPQQLLCSCRLETGNPMRQTREITPWHFAPPPKWSAHNPTTRVQCPIP